MVLWLFNFRKTYLLKIKIKDNCNFTAIVTFNELRQDKIIFLCHYILFLYDKMTGDRDFTTTELDARSIETVHGLRLR